MRAPRSGGSPVKVGVVPSAVDIALSPTDASGAGRRIYYATSNGHRIVKLDNVNGQRAPWTLAANQQYPQDLAVDIFAVLDHPSAVALDANRVYWSSGKGVYAAFKVID